MDWRLMAIRTPPCSAGVQPQLAGATPDSLSKAYQLTEL
jgi:hypothetical protein